MGIARKEMRSVSCTAFFLLAKGIQAYMLDGKLFEPGTDDLRFLLAPARGQTPRKK